LGATLGDISELLNQVDDPDPDALRKLVKVNTTPEIWNNTAMIERFRNEPSIPKTDRQNLIIKRLLTAAKRGKAPNYKRGDKQSLAALERSKAFESYLQNLVQPLTFEELQGGTLIEDMDLTPFENALRSNNSSQQNEYVSQPTRLSAVLGDHQRALVNACSYHPNLDFTGVQIDR
jgi:hypothetical protein